MKVLVITKYFPPEIGAASHLFYELAESLHNRGHHVNVVTEFPSYNVDEKELELKYRKSYFLKEIMDGVKIKRLRLPSVPKESAILRGLSRLSSALASFFLGLFTTSPDLIIVYSPPLSMAYIANWLGWIKDIPVVVNVQDLFPQNAIDLGLVENKIIISFLKWIEHSVYQYSDWITVHSSQNKKHIVANGGTRRTTSVIHNWVDTSFLAPGSKDNSFSEKFGLTGNFVVSFAGTLGYSQDIDIILESAAELEEYDDLLYLIVGDGVEKDRLVEKCRELDLNNVKFVPMQPREDYPKVLHSSDVSLVTLKPSVKTPVVPSKLPSIMATATPVLASMNLNGDAPELIDRANCGICVEAGDKESFVNGMERLYLNDELRAEFGRNGRKYVVNKLSREYSVDKYEEVFRKLYP